MKRLLRGAVLCGWACLPRAAAAQSISLPKLDSLNVSVQGGWLVSSGDWSAKERWCQARLCGWGFETLYNIGGTDFEERETARRTDRPSAWQAQLAVGYDHVVIQGTVGDGYELLGSVRSLPSLSVYAVHESGFYLGMGSGLTQLKDVRLYSLRDGPEEGRKVASMFGAAGDTFGLSFMAGVVLNSVNLFGRPIDPFVEVAYRVRHFSSLNYTLASGVEVLPADLPRSVYAGGVVVSVGFEFAMN